MLRSSISTAFCMFFVFCQGQNLKMVLPNGHYGEILTASYSKDGQRIITAGTDGSYKIWDGKRFQLLTDVKAHMGEVITAVFSDNGKKIFTASSDGTLKTWDGETYVLKHTLKSFYEGIEVAVMSKDGTKVFASSEDFITRIYDAETGMILFTLNSGEAKISSASFNVDGKKLVASSNDHNTKVWSTETGKLIINLEEQESAKFSPDGKNIITVSKDQLINIWNAETGRLLTTLTSDDGIELQSAWFTADGKKVVASSAYYGARVWDLETKKMIRTVPGSGNMYAVTSNMNADKIVFGSYDHSVKFYKLNGQLSVLNGHRDVLNSISFSPDGAEFITASADGSAHIWNAESGSLIGQLKGHISEITAAGFTSDDTKILTFSKDSLVRVWDIQTAMMLTEGLTTDRSISSTMKDSWLVEEDEGEEDDVNISKELGIAALLGGGAVGGGIKFKVFSHDKTKVLTTGEWDNIIKLWQVKPLKLLCSFIAIDSIDYVSQVPSGYYRCTPAASKLLYYLSPNQKPISFDLLDIRFNRPDLILQHLGSPDKKLINSFRHAYEKRVKKMGIDTTLFKRQYSLPSAGIVNKDMLKREQDQQLLKLHLQATDKDHLLDRLNVSINDVPLFGVHGISVRNRKLHSFDTIITVELSQGQNRIETFAFNSNQTESYHLPLSVRYTPAQLKKEKVYFVGIGLDKFQQPGHNLQWCVKDIKDLSEKLKQKYAGNIEIYTLFNEEVTVTKIQELKKHLLNTSVDDKVIISYSGHGLLNNTDEFFLSTYNIDFKKPENGGLPYDILEGLLDNIKARKKLLLIDACHSGELDRDTNTGETKDANISMNGSIKEKIQKKGIEEEQQSLNESFQLMQEIFANVAKGTGATVISASGALQSALEISSLKNGAFTYSILEAFNTNQNVTVSNLKRMVSTRVMQLTNNAQRPTSRTETNNYDWIVW